MTIKQLQKILDQAPDKNAKIYFHLETNITAEIGHSFDDNNDLSLYAVCED